MEDAYTKIMDFLLYLILEQENMESKIIFLKRALQYML